MHADKSHIEKFGYATIYPGQIAIVKPGWIQRLRQLPLSNVSGVISNDCEAY